MNQKGVLQAVLLLGFFISTVWFSLGYFQGNLPPVSEPDTLIYLQYARNMAEGHPYEYIQGDAPSTGCTSYLYPVLLALLYKAGCTGNAFITASFFLNAAFFLTALLLIGLVARRLTSRFYPFVLIATVISGQTLNAFFGQTDMGLLFMLVWFCFWAFLTERKICLLAGMLLAGLTHPTSASLAGGLLAVGGLYALLDKRPWKKRLAVKTSWPLWIGGAGVAAIMLTLVFNYLLTGEFIFMSLRVKGLFKAMPFGSAVSMTLLNLANLLKGVFFGVSDQSLRHLYFFPLITGLCALVGILIRPWNKKSAIRFDALVIFTVIAKLALLSTNQQQGVSHDRYMAWVIPVLFLYAAMFFEFLHDRIPDRPVAVTLAGMLAAFQLVSFVFFTASFANLCDLTVGRTRFANDVMEYTEEGDRIAMLGMGGIIYYLPDRKICNPTGIFSTEYATGRDWLCYIETIKYNPQWAPDTWLIIPEQHQTDPAYEYFLGDVIIKDTDTFRAREQFSLYAADWSSLTQKTPQPAEDGWTLKGRLDIGLPADEKEARYSVHNRLRGMKTRLCVTHDEKQNLTELGQLVIGMESFSIQNLLPEKPLQVILRTARQASTSVSRHMGVDTHSFTFSSPLHLTIKVDEKPLEVSVALNEEGFSDVSFLIPAEYITRAKPQIKVIGDHVSYAYWFFQ